MGNLLAQIGRGGPAFFQAFSNTTNILSRPGEQKKLNEIYLQEKEKRQLEIDSLKIQAAKEAKQAEIDKKLDTPVNIENIGSVLTKIQPFLVESPYAAKAFKDYLKDMGLSDENGNIIPRDVVNALGDINKDTPTAQAIFFKPEYDMRNGFYNQKLNEYNKYLQEGGDPNDSKGQKLRTAVDILDKRRNDVLERQRNHLEAYTKLQEAKATQDAATQHEKDLEKYKNELPQTTAQKTTAGLEQQRINISKEAAAQTIKTKEETARDKKFDNALNLLKTLKPKSSATETMLATLMASITEAKNTQGEFDKALADSLKTQLTPQEQTVYDKAMSIISEYFIETPTPISPSIPQPDYIFDPVKGIIPNSNK